MLWLLISVLSFAIALYVLKSARTPCNNGRPLPRPSDTLPLLGNAIRFLQPRHQLFPWFLTQQRQFSGQTYAISVPSLPPGVVISSPENLEFVLKNESLVTKGDFFRTRAWDLFGHGIINATGPLWKAQRKAGLRFFSGETLDAMVEEVLPEFWTDIVERRLDEASATDTKEWTTVDLQHVFHDLTTAIMGHMAYDIPALTSSHPFSRAFDFASGWTAIRFQNPLYTFTELFNGGKFRKAVAEVKHFGLQIVARAKRRRGNRAFESLVEGNDAPQFNTLIDSLIEAIDNPIIVADSAMNFLSAGRDTTAESLTWTTYALLRHPQVLSRLRQEITTAFPTSTQNLTLASLQPSTIPYILATFYESLRLYPPVPLEIQQCEADCTLPDGTFLPKSSVIVFCIWALNRSVDLWGEDAEQFRPERWLDDDGKFAGRSAWDFPVFNGGPRACLGRKMAEVLGCWVLVRLVEGWHVEEVRDGDGDRVSAMSLTLPMKGGLPVRVRRRATAATAPEK